MIWKTLPLLVIVALSGCASPKYNYSPTSVSISEPPLGSVTTVRVGDVMLKQGKYREHDALYFRTARKVGIGYTVQPGYYLKDGEGDSAEFYSASPGEEGGRIDKIFLADRSRGIMTKKNTSELCVVSVYNAYTCVSIGDTEKAKRPVLAQDAFQQTLIYNGRVGSKINVAYREFSNSVARPAFSNNVEYDLNESMRIGYKGAELELLEATNQHIKFRTLHNFNGAR